VSITDEDAWTSSGASNERSERTESPRLVSFGDDDWDRKMPLREGGDEGHVGEVGGVNAAARKARSLGSGGLSCGG
jgi:hypothetical protein